MLGNELILLYEFCLYFIIRSEYMNSFFFFFAESRKAMAHYTTEKNIWLYFR